MYSIDNVKNRIHIAILGNISVRKIPCTDGIELKSFIFAICHQ